MCPHLCFPEANMQRNTIQGGTKKVEKKDKQKDTLPFQTLVCFGGAAPGTDRTGLSGRCSQTPV